MENVWTILSWVMSGVALTGTILNAERNICGFLFWLVSNLYMTIRFMYIGEYAQALLFLIYFILAIRGIMVWGAKERRIKRRREREHRRMNDDETWEKIERLRRKLKELELDEKFEEGNKKV